MSAENSLPLAGNRMLGIRVTPLTQRRLTNFRANRRFIRWYCHGCNMVGWRSGRNILTGCKFVKQSYMDATGKL